MWAVRGRVHVLPGSRGLPLCAPFIPRCLVHAILGAIYIPCLSLLCLVYAFANEFSRPFVVFDIVCRILSSLLLTMWLEQLELTHPKCLNAAADVANWVRVTIYMEHAVSVRLSMGHFSIHNAAQSFWYIYIYIHVRKWCIYCFLLPLLILFFQYLVDVQEKKDYFSLLQDWTRVNPNTNPSEWLRPEVSSTIYLKDVLYKQQHLSMYGLWHETKG